MRHISTYYRRRAQGLCPGCGGARETSTRVYCVACRRKAADYYATVIAPGTVGPAPAHAGPMIARGGQWHEIHLESNDSTSTP